MRLEHTQGGRVLAVNSMAVLLPLVRIDSTRLSADGSGHGSRTQKYLGTVGGDAQSEYGSFVGVSICGLLIVDLGAAPVVPSSRF
jgi:hypothetical protein